MYRGAGVPSIAEVQKFKVSNARALEAKFQPLYDYQVYPAAGTAELTFFAVPSGQSGKTLNDTNMEIAGSLPSPQSFLTTAIQVCFWPGGLTAAFGAQAVCQNVNDVSAVARSGRLEVMVSNKLILGDGPLGIFPPDFRLATSHALTDQTTPGANLLSRVDYAVFAGRTYEVTPFLIESAQAFNVKMKWPILVPLPSVLAGRIGVRLLGTVYGKG